MNTHTDWTKRDRTLDETVTANALLWLRRRVASHKVLGREYFIGTLATEMAPFLFSLEERQAEGFRPIPVVSGVARQVRVYLGLHRTRPKQPWRLDYLDAFCGAMKVTIHDLLVTSSGLSGEDLRLLESMDIHAPWLAAGKTRKGAKTT